MIARHLGRTTGVVAAVCVLCFGLAGMIGQDNDGPWGDLPAWMGAVGWFGFLLSLLVLVVLLVVLGVQRVRHRGGHPA